MSVNEWRFNSIDVISGSVFCPFEWHNFDHLIWCPNWCGWCFRLLYIECDLAVVWERFQGFDCECSQRGKVQICDNIIYSAVTKSWAVGVSAERVSSQSSIDDVQSQVLTELQQLPSVSVHLRITVLSGGGGGNNLLLSVMNLEPCDSMKSNLSPVLELKSPINSTFPWVWKWLISCSMFGKVSSWK